VGASGTRRRREITAIAPTTATITSATISRSIGARLTPRRSTASRHLTRTLPELLGGPHPPVERSDAARLIGTWRASGNRQDGCVRRCQPAIKVTVERQRFRTILIGLDEAEFIADGIRSGHW
jgi:hypothetical protein